MTGYHVSFDISMSVSFVSKCLVWTHTNTYADFQY